MKKIICLLCLFLNSLVFAYIPTIDYSSFNSITEVINFETSLISSIHPADTNQLSEAYISRAESYLLSDQAEKAIVDLQKAYELALSCLDSSERSYLNFRSLFGMAIAYSNMGMENYATEVSTEISKIVDFLHCEDCHDKHRHKALGLNHSKQYFYVPQITKCIEMQGPDYNVPGWCEDVVIGTADTMRFLASLAKTARAKATLLGIISSLESRCLRCCKTGEFWKVCVSPIVEKWKQWNDKYRFFQIPPDPAWD